MTALRDEIGAVIERFGIAPEQAWRDHFVSHILAAISRTVSTDDVIFFGGTALSRTHLTDVRLSEDIDLIATGRRSDVAADIERAARWLRHSHGAVEFDPPMTSTAGVSPSVMRTAQGLLVQLQLLPQEGYPKQTVAPSTSTRGPERRRTLANGGCPTPRTRHSWMLDAVRQLSLRRNLAPSRGIGKCCAHARIQPSLGERRATRGE